MATPLPVWKMAGRPANKAKPVVSLPTPVAMHVVRVYTVSPQLIDNETQMYMLAGRHETDIASSACKTLLMLSPASAHSLRTRAMGVRQLHSQRTGSLPRCWYCIQSKPHAERIAKRYIEQLGYQVLLPLISKTRKVRTGASQEYLAPLFGNYLFVAFDKKVHEWRRLWNVYGVRRIFSSSPDNPTPVPDEAIDTLLQCFTETSPKQQQIISKGARVKITEGPLSTMENPIGICDWTDGQRIALLLDVMSGNVRIEFALSSVELAP